LNIKKNIKPGVLISIIHRHGSMYINRKLNKYGISSGQHAYLLYVNDFDGCNQEDIVRIFKIDKANVARAVKKLVDEGYIEKKVNSKDNRSNTLNITDKGLKIITKIEKTLSEWKNILTNGLTDDQMNITFQTLEKMAENAEQLIQ
jgi:DNA-binding MarR family transcriptional regulator